MIKKSFITALLVVVVVHVYSQVLPYFFEVDNQPYQELTGATSLNGNTNWEDPDYLIPIGFDFFGFGEWNNEMTFGGVFGYGGEVFLGSFDGSEPANHLCPYGLDIHDPNMGTNLPPAASIYQLVDGTEPNRICKIEWRNVGFFLDETGLMRMNFQMWLHESSNMIEFRYGPSENFNLADVQELNGILIGLSKDFNFNDFTFNYLWALSGDAIDPQIDAYDSFSIDFQIAEQVLQNPTNGTVYRFNNLEISVAEKMENGWSISPSLTRDKIYCKRLNADQATQIEIYDTCGKKVMSEAWSGSTKTMNVESFKPGIYMVRCTNDPSMISKFIKQ
jgi:Secretion system C-terminal sorting domain